MKSNYCIRGSLTRNLELRDIYERAGQHELVASVGKAIFRNIDSLGGMAGDWKIRFPATSLKLPE